MDWAQSVKQENRRECPMPDDRLPETDRSSCDSRLPAALPGFERINRYWDPVHGVAAAKILPGEYYVTQRAEVVVTVLGSCVSACIRDRVLGIGGMNHFMLPGEQAAVGRWHPSEADASTRYGSYAMERLINDILKNGGQRRHLEVKIVGGARILAGMTDIGQRNLAFVREYIAAEGLRFAGEHTGGICPRKVYYFPQTGKVRLLKIRTLHNDTILAREAAYRQALERKPVEGEVELF
jgi:chemotaxis protein CheD